MGRMHVDRFSLVASMVLVSSLVSGCSDVRNYFGGVDNREKPAELAELEGQKVAIETIWSEDVGSGVENQYLRLTPVIAEGRVFAANGDGDVTCYDAQTGKKLWSRDLEVAITGGPGTDGDVVVVGSDDGDVVAMLAGGGDELWRARVSSEILAAPRIADGVVVVRTIDGKLFGIDRSSGKRRWIYDRSVPVLTLRGTSPPAVARGLAINGFDSGRLVAVSIEDGETVWEARLATPRGRTELERLVDIDAEALARAVPEILDEAAWDRHRGAADPARSHALAGRLLPATSLAAAATADLIIESVIERTDLKRRVLAEIEAEAVVAAATRECGADERRTRRPGI